LLRDEQSDSVSEQGVEKNIYTYERGSNRRLEILRNKEVQNFTQVYDNY
jgi:hypothetical protein